ncbi:E3 ubiquitin-protein ligase RDUF1 [Linum grandiflorum]
MCLKFHLQSKSNLSRRIKDGKLVLRETAAKSEGRRRRRAFVVEDNKTSTIPSELIEAEAEAAEQHCVTVSIERVPLVDRATTMLPASLIGAALRNQAAVAESQTLARARQEQGERGRRDRERVLANRRMLPSQEPIDDAVVVGLPVGTREATEARVLANRRMLPSPEPIDDADVVGLPVGTREATDASSAAEDYDAGDEYDFDDELWDELGDELREMDEELREIADELRELADELRDETEDVDLYVTRKTREASESAIEKLERVEIGGGWKPEDCCSVCLEDMAGDDGGGAGRLIRMDCKHVFHESCLVSWLRTSNACPLCRFQVSD